MNNTKNNDNYRNNEHRTTKNTEYTKQKTVYNR
jgi:hypothetical protein